MTSTTKMKKTLMPKLSKTKTINKRPTKGSEGISYLGVSLNVFQTKTGEWKVYSFKSRINNKSGEQEYLGSYKTPLDAAKAYNKRAKAMFGEKKAKNLKRWNFL
jgi:hypothetical protein